MSSRRGGAGQLRPGVVDVLEDRLFFSSVTPPAVVVAVGTAAPQTAAAQTAAAPVITYGANGPTKITYNGTTLYDTSADPYGAYLPTDLTLFSAQGVATQTFHPSNYTTQWNAQTKQLTWSFSWGTVQTTFAQTGSEIDLTTTIHNTSATTTVGGVGAQMNVHFPTVPTGLNANNPTVTFGTNDPAVVTGDFGTGAMAVVNTDATKLYSGFIGATGTNYQLWISSTPRGNDPTSWPTINRNIAPGASDTYHVALRFGPTGSTSQTLAPDAYANALAQNPLTVNWSDRRPIGMDVPAGSTAAGRSATNPNGWFNDPTVNVKTQSGLAAFSTRLLAYADSSVAELKKMNAQGVIMWDMEGERYTGATYVGDPRITLQLAPELKYNNLIGQFFKKFTDAGLRVGMTIRPTQFTLNGASATQVGVSNTAQLLINKIDYAKSHWGCTMFYIDSDQAGRMENDSDVFKIVAAAEPGVLLIPEHTTTRDYASAAGYQTTPTDPSVLATYSSAFSVVNVSGDTLDATTQATLTAAVARGDILMFHGWYDDANNATISQIYQTGSAQASATSATDSLSPQLVRKTTASDAASPASVDDETSGKSETATAHHKQHRGRSSTINRNAAVFSNSPLAEVKALLSWGE